MVGNEEMTSVKPSSTDIPNGRLEFLRVSLLRHVPVYYTGESLVGYVCFRVVERIRINQISVQLLGEGRVSW